MIHPQNMKFAAMLSPISVNGTAATTTEVDTLGYDYATVIVQSGTLAATMDELSVGHSDTSGSGFAAITGGTFVDPVTSTDDNKIFVAFIDLRKTKRYLKLVADPGAGASLVSCVCLLNRAEVTPTSASERGVAQQLIP